MTHYWRLKTQLKLYPQVKPANGNGQRFVKLTPSLRTKGGSRKDALLAVKYDEFVICMSEVF